MAHSRTFKTTILSFGRILTTFSGLISIVVLSRLFSKQDYATYRQTLLVYTFIAPLLASGLPQSLYYFIPRDRNNSRSILMGNLLMLFLIGIIFMVAILFGGNHLIAKKFSNPALASLLLIYSPYALLALPVLNINACLMSCDRVKTLVGYNISSRFFTVILVVGLVLVWRTPKASIVATVLAELIVFVPAMILMYRATVGAAWNFNIGNLWQQVKYSVPLGFASGLGKVDMSLDKLIVSSMCAPDIFAVYVNGSMEIPLIGVLTGSITSVLLPDIVRFYKEDNKTAALELWKRASVKCAMVLLPVMCFLMVMASEIMTILFSAKYAESVRPFRVYLLLLPIRVVTWGTMLMAAGKTRLVLYNMIGGLVLNLGLSVILVHQIGYIGAVLGTVMAIYIWNVPFNIIAISKLYSVSFWKILPFVELFKIMLVGILASVICFFKVYLPISNSIITLCIAVPAYIVVLLILMLKFKLLKVEDITVAISRLVAEISGGKILLKKVIFKNK